MNLRRKVAVAGGTAAMALATASGASAATIPVSPGGSDTCGLGPACSLVAALTTGVTGNDLVLAPGEYSLPPLPLTVLQPRSIAGDPDQPRPRITLASGATLPMPTEALRRVEIVAADTPLAVGAATLEDGVVTSAASPAVSLTTGLIRNTVVHATGAGASAVEVAGLIALPAAARLRNATIIADGAGATAVRVRGDGLVMPAPPDPPVPPSCLMLMPASADLRNVIARGAGKDLWASSHPCGTGSITATTSNFDPDDSTLTATSAIAGRGNQSDVPIFVDAAAGNLAQAAGSPTIDAGSLPADPSELGTLDLAGVQRILGSLPDIGAFEFVPPATPPGGSNPGGDNPGGGGNGGGTPPPGSGATDAKPKVKLAKPGRLRLGALLKRGWRLRVSCSEACRFAMTLTPAKRKKRVLARGAARTKKAGSTTLRLRVTKAGRRALKAQKRSIRLRVAVVARDSAGQRGTASRVLRARR